MRVFLLLFAFICNVTLLFAYETWVDPTTGIEWKYEIVNDTGASLYGGGNYYGEITTIPKETSGEIIIPSHIDALPTVAIGDYAFNGCTQLTRVEIPNTVKSIGLAAFMGCSKMERILIPASVLSIGYAAFATHGPTRLNLDANNPMYTSDEFALFNYDQTELIHFISNDKEHYEIPSTVKVIKTGAFSGTNISSVNIPEGVTTIENGVFNNCKNLKSVRLPDSITYIGHHTFSNCTSLDAVTLSSNITTITIEAFSNCTSLKSLELSEGVVRIESLAFKNCSSLSDIILPTTLTSIAEDAFTDVHPTTLTTPFLPSALDFSTVKHLTFNKPIVLPANRFQNNTVLESVSFAEGTVQIGDAVFQGCENLKSVTLPNTLVHIGACTFSSCSSLETITIPDSVTSVGNCLFEECSKLHTIKLSKNLKRISDCMFAMCEQLSAIEIPESVTEIGTSAFAACKNLTSIHIPQNVKTLGLTVFGGCNNLQTLTVAEDNQYFCAIDSVLFNKEMTDLIWVPQRLTTYTIPNSVEVIKMSAFSNGQISTITIPNSVTTIEQGAFCECTSLTSITIPNSVTMIGEYAFYGCTSLTSITIPNSITTIEQNTFDGCTSLTSITIPNSVTTIGEYAFFGVAPTTLIAPSIPQGMDTSKLEYLELTNVTDVPDNAFTNNQALRSVKIAEGVTSIGVNAFTGCTNLTSVELPSTITELRGTENVFSGCTKLEVITFNGPPPTSCTFGEEISATGMYSSTYRDEWLAVIEDGEWNGLSVMEKRCYVTLTIIGGGHIEGERSYAWGETLTLTATPMEGRVFLEWSGDVHAMDETITLSEEVQELHLTATFMPKRVIESIALEMLQRDNMLNTQIDSRITEQINAGILLDKTTTEAFIESEVQKQATPIKEAGVQEALENDAVYTKDEMQALAYGDPVIEVKNGVASVGIALEKTTALDGEWKAVEVASPTVKDGKVVVEVQPEEGETTAFYRFTVGDKDE